MIGLIRVARKRNEFQPIVDTTEKIKRGVMRLLEFAVNTPTGRLPILAFSGGKDSIVAYMMCIEAKIKFMPIYSPTSVDPPELIDYIRNVFNPWAKSKNYPIVIFQKYNIWKSGPMKGKMKTMWTLIGNRAIPPTRLARYCCDELKERTGEKDDVVITGVRWEESKSRSKQKMCNWYKGKLMVRPIVDWSEVEVWSYILSNKIPYCKLYDEGWNRLGCIGCPLSSNQKRELNAYPQYRENYIRAFNHMVEYRNNKNMKYGNWKTGKDIMKWWIGDCEVKRNEIDGQCSMF